MTDKLNILLRLRRWQADVARRDFAVALQAEHAAELALEAARAAPSAEAASIPDDVRSPLAGAFAAWLPSASALIARQASAMAQAADLKVLAGADVGTRKMAVEAVEALQAARRVAGRKHTLRKAQSGLDELASRGGHGR